MATSETLTWSCDGETFTGHAAWDGDGPRPAVLVHHAWAGQGDVERQWAHDLAALGYVGVAVDVYGRGDSEPALRERAESDDLRGHVTFHGRIPIEAVPAAVATADIGLAPTRRDRFTDVSLSTKLFEYGAMGKPVIATALPLVLETSPPGRVCTSARGDAAGLAAAILAIVDDPAARERAVARTHDIVTARSWAHHAIGYVALVESLARGRGAPRPPLA